MKIIFSVILLSNFIYSDTSTIKWIDPSPKLCASQGGDLTAKGVCNASWSNAEKICSVLDAYLPSVNKLQELIENCGGIMNQSDFNKNNTEYKSCYQASGFVSGYYWSSNEHDWHIKSAYYIHIGRAYKDSNFKFDTNYVRCIKK